MTELEERGAAWTDERRAAARGEEGRRRLQAPRRRAENRVMLVTGAGSGIGAAVAQRAAGQGWQVVICGRRPGPLAEVAARTGARPVVTDVADPDAVEALVVRPARPAALRRHVLVVLRPWHFALACIYLLMSVGALRGLADHPKRWAVFLAAGVGIVVMAAAIYGSVYQVAAPIIWAVWAGVGIPVVGFVLTFVFPGRAPLTSTFDALAEVERGPQKI